MDDARRAHFQAVVARAKAKADAEIAAFIERLPEGPLDRDWGKPPAEKSLAKNRKGKNGRGTPSQWPMPWPGRRPIKPYA